MEINRLVHVKTCANENKTRVVTAFIKNNSTYFLHEPKLRKFYNEKKWADIWESASSEKARCFRMKI